MKLKPLPNTVVHVSTKEEFDELISIYKDAGWLYRWRKRLDRLTYTPTAPYISVSEEYVTGNAFGFSDLRGYKVLSLQGFKKEQGLMKKELKDMEVGDVLIDEYDGERTVLEVLTKSFLPSGADNPAIASMSWITFASAEKRGWHFKDQPAPKKLTHKQLEEALGYPVEIVEGE